MQFESKDINLKSAKNNWMTCRGDPSKHRPKSTDKFDVDQGRGYVPSKLYVVLDGGATGGTGGRRLQNRAVTPT